MTLPGDAGSTQLGNRGAFLIVTAYLAIWALLLIAADSGCHLVGADCASRSDRYGSWLAFHILDGKWFDQDPVDPANPYTMMPPGYALWLTGIFAVFGRDSVLPAIILQALAFGIVALFARQALERHLPGLGNPTLVLLLLNSNVIAQTALSQADPVFMVVTAIVMTLVLHYLLRPALTTALAIGLTIGISAMIKVPGQYLMLLLPIALPLLTALSPEAGTARAWRHALVHGVAATVLAAAVVAPWAAHMWRSGAGVTLQNRGIMTLLLEDGARYLGDRPVVIGDPNIYRPGQPSLEKDVAIQREAELAQRYPGFENFPIQEKHRLRSAWMIDFYLEFPGGVPVFLRALALSWARVLLPGGEGEWHRLFAMEARPDTNPTVFYGIKYVVVALTLASRVLAVLGIVALFRQRRYDLLVLTVCWVALFTGLTALVGNTRYRLPSELPLAMLAGAGWLALRAWWSRTASRRSPPARAS